MSTEKPISSEVREEVLAAFSDSLAADPGLDASAREMLMRRVEESLAQPQDPVPADPEEALATNRAQWISTLDMLCENEALDASERESLIQQFDESMQPLQSEDFKQALRHAQEAGLKQQA